MPANDPWSRIVHAEGWVNGQSRRVAFVIHADQVTIVSGENRSIEFEIGVWRLLTMHIAVKVALLSRRIHFPAQ